MGSLSVTIDLGNPCNLTMLSMNTLEIETTCVWVFNREKMGKFSESVHHH
jgi:hypothetical protein